jgi:hypothetical protein
MTQDQTEGIVGFRSHHRREAHLLLKPHEAAEQLVVVPVQLLDLNGRKFRFRTRVSADEVARILRRCRVPEPWNNPSACTDIGTLPMRTKPHPAALAVQKALEDLKGTIAAFNDAEINYFEQARTARNRGYRGEPGLNEFPRQVSERVRQLSKQLDKVRNIVPGTYKFTAWHWSAAILFEEYKLIVGAASPAAGGPAVQFVHLLLIRLGLGERSPAAIEKALRRSSANPFRPSHLFGFEM